MREKLSTANKPNSATACRRNFSTAAQVYAAQSINSNLMTLAKVKQAISFLCPINLQQLVGEIPSENSIKVNFIMDAA
jgi:hypothetical protein